MSWLKEQLAAYHAPAPRHTEHACPLASQVMIPQVMIPQVMMHVRLCWGPAIIFITKLLPAVPTLFGVAVTAGCTHLLQSTDAGKEEAHRLVEPLFIEHG